jgi:hypothetical protein
VAVFFVVPKERRMSGPPPPPRNKNKLNPSNNPRNNRNHEGDNSDYEQTPIGAGYNVSVATDQFDEYLSL